MSKSFKKKAVLLLIVNLSMVGLASGYFVWNYQNALIDDVLSENQFKILSKSDTLQNFIDSKSRQVSLLTTLPAIQGTLKFFSYGDSFAFGQDELLNLLEEESHAILSADSDIMQIALIEVDGIELFRIDSNAGDISVASIPELSDVIMLEHFTKAISLDTGTHVTNIHLNTLDDQILTPHTSVLYISAPVTDANGIPLGVFAVKYNMDQVLEELIPTDNGKTIVFDQDGDFIHHVVGSKEFGFMLGTGHNYFTEQPELYENVQKLDSKFHHDDEENEFRIWAKIFYSNDPEKFWVIVSVVTEDELYEPVKEITIGLSYIWFGIIGLTVGLTLMVAKIVSKPEYYFSKINRKEK